MELHLTIKNNEIMSFAVNVCNWRLSCEGKLSRPRNKVLHDLFNVREMEKEKMV
jgi:hypothetical protein